MSKKHYILIAEELNAALAIARGEQGKEGKSAQNAVFRLVEGLATVLQRDNPRFNRAVFYRACGVQAGDGLN